MQRSAPYLTALSLAVGLGGCAPLSLGLAAVDALTGGSGGAGAPQQAQTLSPEAEMMQSLASMNDQVTKQCRQSLADIEAKQSEAPDQPATAGAQADTASAPSSPAATPPSDAITQSSSAAAQSNSGATRAATANAQACQVRLVCLPGADVPTSMMVCADKTQASTTQASAPAQGPIQVSDNTHWAWMHDASK